jgi:hypothetical protein
MGESKPAEGPNITTNANVPKDEADSKTKDATQFFDLSKYAARSATKIATLTDPMSFILSNVEVIRVNDGAPAAPQQACLRKTSDPAIG